MKSVLVVHKRTRVNGFLQTPKENGATYHSYMLGSKNVYPILDMTQELFESFPNFERQARNSNELELRFTGGHLTSELLCIEVEAEKSILQMGNGLRLSSQVLSVGDKVVNYFGRGLTKTYQGTIEKFFKNAHGNILAVVKMKATGIKYITIRADKLTRLPSVTYCYDVLATLNVRHVGVENGRYPTIPQEVWNEGVNSVSLGTYSSRDMAERKVSSIARTNMMQGENPRYNNLRIVITMDSQMETFQRERTPNVRGVTINWLSFI